jgi:uncharacterized protein (DUF362 family)
MAAVRSFVLLSSLVAACRGAEPAARPAGAVIAIDAAAAPVAIDPVSDAPPAPPVKTSPPVDTTTGASPTWTPGPAVVTEGSVDGAALRAAHRARLAADRTPVTVLRGGTALELGARICEAVVPARPAAMPVLLKPNLGGFDWFRNPRTNHGDDGVTGRITDPEFVRGVIHCLKQRGHTAITIADGFTGKAADWQRLVRVSGYAAMAAQEHVALVAMDDDGVFDVSADAPGKPLAITGMEKTKVPTLLVPKIYAEHLDHGLIISLPKIKTHRFSVFSLGIKAMQATAMYADASPAFHQKWRSHREIGAALELIKRGAPGARAAYVKSLELFAQRMADVLEIDAPDVVLAEGAPAMNGDGFEKLLPVTDAVAIGGTNVITVDRVGAEFLGLWDSAALARELGGHKTSPLLEVAARRFGVDIASPRLAGDGASLLASRRPAHLIAMAGFTIDDDAPPSAAAPHVHAAHLADDEVPALDSPLWDRAEPLEFATDFAGRVTPHATTVRALWSSHALYLRWSLSAAGLSTDQSRPIDVERIDLYEEDCVELFLAPDPAVPRRYFEIEVGPYGHFFDIAIDRTGTAGARKADNDWSAHLQIATARDAAAHTATIEYAITAPEIVAGLHPGATLPVGLDRMEGAHPRAYLSAFPSHLAKPNFHAPEAFGTLLLDP